MSILLLTLLGSCATFRRPTVPNDQLARRLVLALDGIDYRDVVAARERGLFTQFRAPSRLVSTFPSISDIAWHEIFGVLPPRGYQRIFYSNAYNDVLGGALDAIRPIEFEDRMDMAFGTKFHHLSAYVASNSVARHEVTVAVRDFFTIRDRPTVYVYNVGPDALQHTRGDLTRYLAHLDAQLAILQATYQIKTGRTLEIVLLSDHGHNRGIDAQFLPVLKTLESHGFRMSERLAQQNDVAFSVDGVTTGFGVFVAPSMRDSLVNVLKEMDGVDIVSLLREDGQAVVHARAGRARVERRVRGARELFRYVIENGDPLRLADAVADMQREGAADAEGFASSASWVKYTSALPYPAAPERIIRGHTSVTLNPAPILVSLADGYRVGLGMVSIANRMRPLGGTHGALSATNALGILMTNFVDTHDDVTATVRTQVGHFADLGPVRYRESGARITNAFILGRDTRGPFASVSALGNEPGDVGAPALEVWLTPEQRRWLGASAAFFVQVQARASGKQAADAQRLATSYLPVPLGDGPSSTTDVGEVSATPGWIASADAHRFLLPLGGTLRSALRANTNYTVRIVADRLTPTRTGSESTSRVIATIQLRTTASAAFSPY
ncbi:MAG: hypothetical protein IT353_08075 [Gemmatimonadaceae bacterium]|nr:hypothetical protein [Gemmatimonadaceae bacterium]